MPSDTILSLNLDAYPEMLTVADLRKILRIGRNACYDLVRKGLIRSIRFGKNIRIPKSSLIDYLRRVCPPAN